MNVIDLRVFYFGPPYSQSKSILPQSLAEKNDGRWNCRLCISQ